MVTARKVVEESTPLKKPGPAAKKAAATVAAKAEKAVKAPAHWPKKLPSGATFPASLGAVADAYYDKKHERLALAKVQEAALKLVAEDEKFLKEFIINEVPKSNQGGLMGIRAVAEITKKDVPRPMDWSKIYEAVVKDYQTHVKKKDGQQDGAFALLQRRLGDGAVKDLWDAGKTVPGVEKFTVVDVSITKR